ncbi:MAG: hypothetical protein H0U13_16000 [Gemmatimonadaceae bacterium]|nr:hypothetical protein [Gemmatimonadaceae bacterium]
MIRVFLIGLFAAFAASVNATNLLAQQASAAASPIRVFIDCQYDGCDFDFFRTEIPFVDYVRNRQDAALNVFITRQRTAAGGNAFTLNFIGQKQLAGTVDTMLLSTPQAATEDEIRRGLARTIKLGLVRYVARSPLAERLQVTLLPAASSVAGPAARSADDGWNFWVFRTRANGFFNGEKSQRFADLSGSVSANRTTDAWKLNLSLNGNYGEGKFTFSNGTKFANYSHSYGINELVVRSLTPHWSAGQRASVSSSTFLNQKLAARFAPAVEYNVFPYSESTRRQLTFLYTAGVTSFTYEDTTIFDKLSEVRPHHSLTSSLGLKQPWGSVSTSLEAASYLDDFSKRRIVMFNSLDVRVFKGLSINLFSEAALVRDQLHLVKGKLSDEDILLRQRQLATSYRYFASLGVTYTFGSALNNVVNTRFDGPSGFR